MIVPAAVSDWESVLPLLDGLIVSGGTDIDPIEYGGDRANPALLPADRERDYSELTLVRRLLDESDTPLLCICRGLQTLNVAAGGTLHEHIPDIHDQDIHRSSSNFWAMQDLRIEPDSLLAKVMGTTALRTASGHHQAVKDVGADCGWSAAPQTASSRRWRCRDMPGCWLCNGIQKSPRRMTTLSKRSSTPSWQKPPSRQSPAWLVLTFS